MKQLIAIIFFFTVKICGLYSQGSVQEFPALHKQNPDIHFQRLSISDNTGFYCIFENKKLKNYSVDKFDFQGKPLSSAKIQDEPVFEVVSDKSLFIFSSSYDKSGKKGKLSLVEVNLSTGAKSPEKMIDQIDVIKEHDFSFHFSLSPDKTKLLVVSHYFCLSEELPEKAVFRFFEINGMKQIWEKELDNKFKEFYLKTDDYATDNDGNVFLSYEYSAKIIEIKAHYGTKSKGIINSKDKTINEVSLNVGMPTYSKLITNDGKIVIASVCKVSMIPNRAGILFLTIDMKTGKILTKKINPFSLDVEKKLDYNGNGSGYLDFNSAEIIEVNDCYYFIANEGYSVIRSYTNSVKSSTTNFSSRLLVSKIKTSTGELEWVKVVPKSTTTKTAANSDAPALNYHTFYANDKINFVFLDHPANFDKYTVENADYNKMGTIQGSRNSNVILVSLDQKGDGTKKLIYENKETLVLPQQVNIMLDKNTLLLYLENIKEKEEKFGSISVK